MNKQRRAALNNLQDRIAAVKAGLESLRAEVEQVKDELEALRDEEQDSFDNLPEGWHQGEKGQDMEAAIANMDEGLGELEGLVDTLDAEPCDSAFSAIEEAKGQA